MDVEMGQIQLGPWENWAVCLELGGDNHRLRQDRGLELGWHQKFHGGSALQNRPFGQGVLWSFQDYRNVSENLDSNISKCLYRLAVPGLKVRVTIKHGQEYWTHSKKRRDYMWQTNQQHISLWDLSFQCFLVRLKRIGFVLCLRR